MTKLSVPYVPNWLKKLPTGLYTLTELTEISGGKFKTSIVRTLKRLRVPKLIGPKVRNMLQVTYKWTQPED